MGYYLKVFIPVDKADKTRENQANNLTNSTSENSQTRKKKSMRTAKASLSQVEGIFNERFLFLSEHLSFFLNTCHTPV